MATIPVEKKSAAPWWLWLLGLLLLLLLLWFFFLRGDDDDVVAVDDVEEVAPMAVTGLDLSDVWVTRVVGDKTFFVAPDSNGTDETLVYLEEESDPTDTVEGRYDVTVGQHLAIVGEMLPLEGVDTSGWDVTSQEMAATAPNGQYVRATSLTVLNDAAIGDDPVGDTIGDASGAISDVNDLYVADLSGLVGQTVEVDNARVLSVVGDSTFYLGEGSRRILVALSGLGESQAGPGDGSDGRFDINTGDRVNVRGTVTRFDAANSAFRALSDADRNTESGRGAFVNVTSAAGVTKR